MDNKFLLIIIFIIIIIAGAFYWFEYRPSEIRKECVKKLTELNDNNTNLTGDWTDLEFFYKSCIRARGLKE